MERARSGVGGGLGFSSYGARCGACGAGFPTGARLLRGSNLTREGVALSSREPGGRGSIPLPRPPRVRSRRPALEKKLVAPPLIRSSLHSFIRSGDLGELTKQQSRTGTAVMGRAMDSAGPVTLVPKLEHKGPSP